MNMGWLGSLFNGLLGLFNPLKNIEHWKIWLELKKWYGRFKKWRDWYRDHVMAPMKQMQAMQRQLYNTIFKPALLLIDHIRQLTSIIGIFNRKLAAKLNYQFLKIESYILFPLNKMTSRINSIGSAMQGIVTPLGYLDRGILLNSIWRDATIVKQILHNPWDQHPAPTSIEGTHPMLQIESDTTQYLTSGTGRIADDISKMDGYYAGMPQTS